MTINIYTHTIGLRHDTGPGHPESPARLQTLLDLFDEMGLDTIVAREADLQWIARAHPMRYIDALQDAIPDRGTILLDNDTVLSPASFDAALYAAGAVCQAVEDMAAGKATRAFCAMRPPGHHAEPEEAMGFCLFNNIFVGALHAQTLGLKRVAIVDFDVHHGNGSDVMARLHDDIFYASTHQWPLFPNTGGPDDSVPGRVLNVQLAAGDGSDAFRAAYRDRVFPALHAFKPDLIMISAGFDAHRDDPLAQINLGEDDFEWVTGELCALADQYAGGKVVSVLEGGYDLPALKSCAAAHIRALSNYFK
jgi:acetoin utilization deacetylase AcuC-like enzyme